MEMFMMPLVEYKGKMVVFDIDDLLVSTRLRLQKYISDLKLDFENAQKSYEDGDYYEFDGIIDYAGKCKGDLIMIMTQQEDDSDYYFIGSTSQGIIHNSDIPVLSIIPKLKKDTSVFHPY